MKKNMICLLCFLLLVVFFCGCDAASDSTGNFSTNLDGLSLGVFAGEETSVYYQNYTMVDNNERYCGLFQNNQEGTNERLLYDDCGGMINVYKGKVYFRNYDFGKLVVYDLKTGMVNTLLSEYFIQYVLVYENHIYFIHMDFENDKRCMLYQCDLNGENVKLCAEGMISYYLDVVDKQLLYIKYDEQNNQEILFTYANETERDLYSWEYQEEVSVKALKDSFVVLSRGEIARYTYEGECIETITAEDEKEFLSLAYNGNLYYIVMDVDGGTKEVYEYLLHEGTSRKVGNASYGMIFVDEDAIYDFDIEEGEWNRILTN